MVAKQYGKHQKRGVMKIQQVFIYKAWGANKGYHGTLFCARMGMPASALVHVPQIMLAWLFKFCVHITVIHSTGM